MFNIVLKNRFISSSIVAITAATTAFGVKRYLLLNNSFSNNNNSGLMDEAYFLRKFAEYERSDSWDQIFHKINLESDGQAKKLSLCCDLSNTFHEKNRYRNVLPYDQNRITLKCGSSENDSYINASPLHLPFARRNYILTQGPLPNTASDFWQMVYEQRVSVCIMLSKVMEKNFIKCHSYFPCKDDRRLKFEGFECELEHEETKPNYIVRRIRLIPSESFKKRDLSANDQSEPRIIHHFQFTTWPDFGVPEHTDHFLDFLEEVRTTREKLLDQEGNIGTPVVCHCSAGIGRTGTFVIVDSVLSMFEKRRSREENKGNAFDESSDRRVEEQLDSLEALVIFIRRHRMGLIQTPQQLRFCWKTIVDWIKKNGDAEKGNNNHSPQKPEDKASGNFDQNNAKKNSISPKSQKQASASPELNQLLAPMSSPEISAVVTDISWSLFGDPLDSIVSSVSSPNNNNSGGVSPRSKTTSPSTEAPPLPSKEMSPTNNNSSTNHSNANAATEPTANAATSSASSSQSAAVRARKRSSNERDELASAQIILPNSGVTVSPRPLSMEQQKRKETLERIKRRLQEDKRPHRQFLHKLRANGVFIVGGGVLAVAAALISAYFYANFVPKN